MSKNKSVPSSTPKSKQSKRPLDQSTKQKAKARKKTVLDEQKVPVISSPKDLIGKIVDHFTDRGEESEPEWFRGIVEGFCGRFSPKNPKFKIRYDDFPDDESYIANLYEDFKNEDLKIVEVVPEDFIGASISHLFIDAITGEETWWEAEVADMDIESSDRENPDFFVRYFSSEDEEEVDDDDFYLLPLFEDYLNGCIRFT